MNVKLTSRTVSPERLTESEILRWREICRRTPSLQNPFYTYGFTSAVARVKRGVRVCVIRRNGDPVAYLPFQFDTPLNRLMGAAAPVGGHMSDYFGLVAEPDFRTSGTDLMRLAGLAYIDFTHLDQTQLAYGLKAEQPHPGMRIEMPEGGRCFLETGQATNRKFFDEISRRRRQLRDNLGELRFYWQDPDWKPSLERLIENKRIQYSRTGVKDVLESPWTRRLLEVLASGEIPECQGMLSTLYAGDTWIASHFGVRHHDVLHYWFPVYNVDVQRFGPGKILLTDIIAAAEEAGIYQIDHGAGDSMYKRSLANNRHYYYRGSWQRTSVRAALYSMGCSLSWRLQAARQKANV